MLASVFMAAGIPFPASHMSASRIFSAPFVRHVQVGLFESKVF
jgi:hypothetical protein